jgi:hypothetical protein
MDDGLQVRTEIRDVVGKTCSSCAVDPELGSQWQGRLDLIGVVFFSACAVE